MHAQRLLLFLGACASVALAGSAHAQEVWSGTDFFFEKQNFADSKLPENQDRITDAVWITRDNAAGIYNRAVESSYGPGDPSDTEWATGAAADWQSLTFAPWDVWHGGGPGGGGGGGNDGPLSTLGVDAVVHLISDDIYLDIRFETWTSGGGGGGFSYFRASDPTPIETISWGAIKSRDFEQPR